MNVFVEACKYIVDNGTTIRDSASVYGLAKSTLHNYIQNDLYNFCIVHGCTGFYLEVMDQIYMNLADRHIRGGNATKVKYQKLKNSKKV